MELLYLRSAHGRLASRPTGEDQRSAYLLTSLAKCVACGGSLVAAKRTAKHKYTRTVYRCAYISSAGTRSAPTIWKYVKTSLTPQFYTP
jgi:hypothetical protein